MSSPVYAGCVVFSVVIMAVGLGYAFLTRELEPSACHDYPLLKVNGQQFRYSGSRWRRGDSERHLLFVQYSFCVDSDRRLSSVWSSCSNVYTRMFANVSQNIRL